MGVGVSATDRRCCGMVGGAGPKLRLHSGGADSARPDFGISQDDTDNEADGDRLGQGYVLNAVQSEPEASPKEQAKEEAPGHERSASNPIQPKHIKDYALRYLHDKQKGNLGPEVSKLLGIEYVKGDAATGKYIRVGVHREGTCFFHSVLDCLNYKAPENFTDPEKIGKDTDDKECYRHMRKKARKQMGHDWRAELARDVDAKWFADTLNHSANAKKKLQTFDAARGRLISFSQYCKDYANPDMYVGDSVWPHISKYFNINLFLIVVSRDKARVVLGSPYDEGKKSVLLYLHDKGGSRGHYESIRRDDGVGAFEHGDIVLERLRLAAENPQLQV